MMGSGGMIVMDETSCMVDVAKYFMDFCTQRILRQVRSLPRGHGADVRAAGEDRRRRGHRRPTSQLLEELCDLVRNTSLCGLGQSAPNGVLTTLRYFRHEYESHIAGQPCGTCRPEKKEAEL